MTSSDEFLTNAAEHARKGEPIRITARELARVFGAEKRGYKVVGRIKRGLRVHGLRTEPDFDGGWIDKEVKLVLISQPESEQEEPPVEINIKVRDLPSALAGVVGVKPQTALSRARTRMLLNDYSQLAVMASKRSLHGYVSWESIGRTLTVNGGLTLKDVTRSDPPIVLADDDLLPLLPRIADDGFTFVRDQGAICGIITAADLTLFFDKLAHPFLLIGELERALRQLIQRHFTLAELEAIRDPDDGDRTVESVDDLSIGEFVRLLDKPDSTGLARCSGSLF